MNPAYESYRHPITQLLHNAKTLGNEPALGSLLHQGERLDEFKFLTWSEVLNSTLQMAQALKNRGVQKGDRVALMAKNQTAWLLVDWACLSLGAVSVPLFLQTQKKELDYIMEDSEAKFLISDKSVMPASERLLTLQDFEKEASQLEPLAETDIQISEPDDLMTLIYTSGTTGEPKGVMHSARGVFEGVKHGSTVTEFMPGDRMLSYLPLSHVAERMLSEFMSLYAGGSIYFVDQVERIAEYLPRVRPHHFFGVPRVWDLFKTKIEQKMREKRLPLFVRWLPEFIRKPLITTKLKKKLGFDHAKTFFSGAAKLNPKTYEFLDSLGIEILEGYGLTETLAVVSFNRPGLNCPGSVGRPFEGVEVNIESDGEIAIRASHLFQGYYNKPEMTAEVMKNDWFFTGDVGELDSKGYLYITDRKKDIFKTSGGKYVAPLPIETHLKTYPSIQEAMVIGENKDHLIAICALNEVPFQKKDLEDFMFEMNRHLPPHERIKHLGCLAQTWTVDGGQLTPTMKIKRKSLLQTYEKEINALFESKERVLIFPNGAGAPERMKCAYSRI